MLLFPTILFITSVLITTTNQQQLPPKLADSAVLKSQNAGTKLKVHCQAAEGSKPLQFSWKRNGLSDARYRIDADEEEESFLIIDRLQASDNGNYTCTVSNAFGTAHQTTVVFVKGFYFKFYYHFCSKCGAFSV